MLTPAEAIWLSGLFAGAALGLPLGIIVDRLFLRPVARFVYSMRRPADDEGK